MRYPIALALLMLADAASTIGMLHLGMASEANPLMAVMITYSTCGFVAGKGILGFMAGLVLRHNPKAARIAALLYVCLILWHIIGWIMG